MSRVFNIRKENLDNDLRKIMSDPFGTVEVLLEDTDKSFLILQFNTGCPIEDQNYDIFSTSETLGKGVKINELIDIIEKDISKDDLEPEI